MKRIYHKAKRHIKRHARYLKKRLNFLQALRAYAGMPVGF